MSVFESILLVFNERATMIQFFCYFTDSLYSGLDWMWSYHGLDWIGSLSCWIGMDWILQNGPTSNSALAQSARNCWWAGAFHAGR